MTIKSIKVTRKPVDLSIGSVVHLCHAFGGKSGVIVGPVEQRHGITKVKMLCTHANNDFYVGNVEYLYLGDLGAPGYAYDDRPSSLFSSKAAAVAHGYRYHDWLCVTRNWQHG